MKSLSIDSTVRCQPDLRSFLKLKDGSSFWYLDLTLNLTGPWYIWICGKVDSASQSLDLNQNPQYLLKLRTQ